MCYDLETVINPVTVIQPLNFPQSKDIMGKVISALWHIMTLIDADPQSFNLTFHNGQAW